jgi:hypothetical protein
MTAIKIGNAMPRQLRWSFVMLCARLLLSRRVCSPVTPSAPAVRAFADLYPELTPGLVMVDASHPDQWVRWPRPHGDQILKASQRIVGGLGWSGLAACAQPFPSDPGGVADAPNSRLRGEPPLPHYAATEIAQTRSWAVSREPLNAAAPLGDLPLAVLALSQLEVSLTALQSEPGELTEDASLGSCKAPATNPQ